MFWASSATVGAAADYGDAIVRLNRDGSVAGAPEFVSQTGATAGNQAYARAFVETAKRAVLRCAPLQLPDDLFPYWKEFELNFDPRLMT